MTRRNSNPDSKLDVLILHGMSQDLVDYLVTLLAAMGLRASSAVALPSLRRKQESKVDYYIKNCRIPMVLLSVDEMNKRGNRARPNVYDEIARCQQLRRNDTIVLREHCDGKPVECGSNVEGQMITLPFARETLHQVIPPLLTELRSRGWLQVHTPNIETVDAGKILNAFLDRMDAIWDRELDAAWNRIHRQDYRAERSFAVKLDKFFQQYQEVFSALIRNKMRGEQLNAVCQAALEESEQIAIAAWFIVAEGKMRVADTISNDPAYRDQLHKHQSLYERASDELTRGEKSEGTPEEQIAHFKHAIELADQYIEGARGSTRTAKSSR